MTTFKALLLVVALVQTALAKPLPLVAWHGMGMSAHDGTMTHYIDIIKKMTNNTVYTRSLRIGVDEMDDKINTFILPVELHLDYACNLIRSDPELWDGYNALGASQGALLMRGLAQRCPWPPMHTFISLCGPQQGVFGIPDCDKQYGKARCDVIAKELTQLVYDGPIQDFETQAQYWHDPTQATLYRERSRYLADANQEQGFKPDYRTNLLKLKKMVLVKFLKDTTVIPPESEWFGFYKENSTSQIYTYKDSPLYTQDLLGLKTMEQQGKLFFESYDDGHCTFSDEWFEGLMKKYVFSD